jgi:hypothetical protein
MNVWYIQAFVMRAGKLRVSLKRCFKLNKDKS